MSSNARLALIGGLETGGAWARTDGAGENGEVDVVAKRADNITSVVERIQIA